MRSVSDLISDTKKQESNGAVVIGAFLVLVVLALGIPATIVWLASGIA
jgi:hypothetical protein